MVRDIVLQTPEPDFLRLRWSRGLSLTARILFVNLFAVVLVTAGLFFLDSYRGRLVQERIASAAQQASIISRNFPLIPTSNQHAFLLQIANQSGTRIRIYDRFGRKLLDSFNMATPTYRIIDPLEQNLQERGAAWLDRIFDFIVMAPALPTFSEPETDTAFNWPEMRALKGNVSTAMARLAPDGSHVISAAAQNTKQGNLVLTTRFAPDILGFVRNERFRVGMYFLVVLAISILMSLFLARTIVRPLRHLARSAVRVRMGRAPEVVVPRLPSRRDEIGMLARALSDMSSALRERISATEAFAADVAHEIKNPLASLRSALDGIEGIEDPKLRNQLMTVAKADVLRMDRLISDISEASRVDSQLATAKFELIDIADMVEQLIASFKPRADELGVIITFSRPPKDEANVVGEDIRLERMLVNLIENALSFSPLGSALDIAISLFSNEVVVAVTDQGPGVPQEQREAIFTRFYSHRPDSERFGEHSGLGLAIARNIAEGHGGQISVKDRGDGMHGSRFEIALPMPSIGEIPA
jgi:two-component system, OmpR family, sensor histidine kinase ChvG